MKKKIIALILCICLISCTCIQPAYAMGAEGIIVGGGAVAAGVTLTMPQVALLVAAGFGLVYATQHAEEIYNGLDTAMTNAANNIENGMEQLTVWQEQAAQGEIAIASAPAWIVDSIKGWITDLYNAKSYTPIACAEYPALTEFPKVDSWSGFTQMCSFDCTVIRAGSISTVQDGAFYSFISKMLVITTQRTGSTDYIYTIDGVQYFVDSYSWATNPAAGELSEYNQKAFDAILQLPNLETIKGAYPNISTEEAMLRGWIDGFFTGSGSVCPDEKVGGIEGALDVGGIDNIKVPDLDIGGSKLLAPPNVGTGAIDDVLNDVLTRLKQQELSWSDYMTDVAVGNPSITIEGKDYVIDDTGVTDIPVEDVVPDNPPADGVVVPEGLEPFTMSLTDFFPFCIPFDIVDFVNVLCAEPESPRFDWTFTWYGGDTDTLTIDLSPFDQVAQLLRNMELLLFCIGLALITRNQIRG